MITQVKNNDVKFCNSLDLPIDVRARGIRLIFNKWRSVYYSKTNDQYYGVVRN